MNKGELIATVAKTAGVPQKSVDVILSSTLNAIVDTVARGDKVALVGFGTFEKRERQERSGRNPKTGETMHIPACSVPGFSAGKAFRDAVNGDEKSEAAA